MLTTFFHYPLVVAALKGAGAAVLPVLAIDFQTFKSWQSLDAAKTYDYKVALFKLVQALVLGAAAGAGIYGVV